MAPIGKRCTAWLCAAFMQLFAFLSFAQQQTQLAGSLIPQFADPLPAVETVSGNSPLEIHMREFQANVLSTGTFVSGQAPATWVWGYVNGPNQPSSPAATYIGPAVIARRGIPTEIKYVNDLGNVSTSNLLSYTQSTDQTIHWADPLNGGANQCSMAADMGELPAPPCDQHYNGSIPATVHLHGGEVPPVIDGGPDSWFTSDGTLKGSAFYSKDGALATNYSIYRYPNSDESEPLWFHDHTLGVTRLNVFSGLAGVYLLTDPPRDPRGLPRPTPLVIQDRSFDVNGQLFFPAGPGFAPNPQHPFWVPEFFGDAIVVNGKTWPFLEVQPKRYRFIIVNGSNARAYRMFFASPGGAVRAVPVWQVATDGGYLDTPVRIGAGAGQNGVQQLFLMPGERADIVVDFSGFAPGTRLILRNNAKAPFPDGDAPNPRTTGRIMQFRVTTLRSPDRSIRLNSRTRLRTPRIVRLVNPDTGTLARGVRVQKTRQLTLNEIMGMPVTVNGVTYPGGSLGLFLNNTKWSGQSSRTYGDLTPVTQGSTTNLYSEIPREGTTEVWEIVNLTEDEHPIHLHLVQFQILNRQPFNKDRYMEVYNAAFPGGQYISGFGPPLDYRAASNPRSGGKDGGNPNINRFLRGALTLPAANEAGWKDTAVMPPGQVTRLAIRFGKSDRPVNTPIRRLAYSFDPNANGAGYVWHCHILDHEDNEMMRPFGVTPINNVNRSYVLGVDY